ncbi:uncharacterized protein PHALS_06560 [Plasmopara halstedii]|uniref:Uncharacterized protein n=1 Tax=Plasmopara halstedii TaxID=4781 RepID=A0A0N7L833_PLAHL|nr:uncharacterized protein PHALS_06560 [Plasmopara halstedii]CEG48755.1 hypothetical protein PHALS_06560 [Plasmopara halstedii]|eukprot:XP_024585124.1 hypothetical protein PHALS_06560 [Plasmopara halstedii]
MAICFLLNYPDEEVVTFVPTADDIIEDYLHCEAAVEDAEGADDDDSTEPVKVTPSEAVKMLDSLEIFWLQQDEQSLGFTTAIRDMKDKVGLIKTRQLKQRSIVEFSTRI